MDELVGNTEKNQGRTNSLGGGILFLLLGVRIFGR